MTTSLYSALLPEVIPFAVECPEIVAINAIRNAAIEFCKKTQIWQVDLAPISTVVGQNDYLLTTNANMPANAEITGIIYGTLNGWPIVGKSADELARIYRWSDWRTWQGDPRYYMQLEHDHVFVVPQPNVVYDATQNTPTNPVGMAFRIAVAPTRASTGMDSVLQEMYYEAIATGAKARLFQMKGQPFYDPQAAMIFQKMFDVAINKTRIAVNVSLQRNSTVAEKQGYVI